MSLFHYKQWLEDGRPDLVSLLKYLMSVEKVKQSAGNHPVVVACKYVHNARIVCSDLHVVTCNVYMHNWMCACVYTPLPMTVSATGFNIL